MRHSNTRASILKPHITHLMILPLVLGLTLFGCGAPADEGPVEEAEKVTEDVAAAVDMPDLRATAELVSADGTSYGTVELTELDQEGVKVVAHLTGLPSSSTHGFHIHETGDCSAPDFMSAGDHFNPTGAEHACPPTTPRHAGDLGNLEVDEDGYGSFELTTDLITLRADESSVVGRAIIVHSDADDCTTQPTGNAGDRIACGTITVLGEAEAETEAEGQGDTY